MTSSAEACCGWGSYAGSGPGNVNIAYNVAADSAGGQFKAGLKDFFLPTKTNVTLSMDGPELPDKRWYIDLDPHYKDIYGDPLARYTSDFTANPYRAATYLSGSLDGVAGGILKKMGCIDIAVNPGVTAGEIPMDNWPAHVRGGCRIGTDSTTSVMNKYMQAWEYPNLFMGGEITDTTGDNTTIGGTHPMGATTYVGAEELKKYLEPGRTRVGRLDTKGWGAVYAAARQVRALFPSQDHSAG